MDPRTFLPAPALAVGSPPGLGDPAPELPVTLEPGRPTVVAFLRHTGCPFAEATLRAMRDAATGGSELQWVAVSHAPADATDRWCRGLGGSGVVQVVSDPSRRSYAAWGLGQTSISHFMGRSIARRGGAAGPSGDSQHASDRHTVAVSRDVRG